MSEADLLRYNRQGLIPGPGESEETFTARVQACLNLKNTLANNAEIQLPFEDDLLNQDNVLKEAFELTAALYDIRPDWLPLFFSNYRLAPWHGGCAWIFQLEKSGPRMAMMQLRKAFAANKNYLSLYQRDELIAHECAHVGRMMFNEERFEEILAYRTSPKGLRSLIGPIVQSPAESLIFIAALFIMLFLDLYVLFTGDLANYNWIWSFKALPAAMILGASLRLWLKQRTFAKCLANLKLALGDAQKASHVIYRLTDAEICEFANLTPQKIIDYFKTQKKNSPRLRLLALAYFDFL